MGDVIDIKSRIKEKQDKGNLHDFVLDRYRSCLENMRADDVMCSCEYCTYISEKSKLIHTVLMNKIARDAKNKGLVLCTNDIRIILHDVINTVNSDPAYIFSEQGTEIDE